MHPALKAKMLKIEELKKQAQFAEEAQISANDKTNAKARFEALMNKVREANNRSKTADVETKTADVVTKAAPAPVEPITEAEDTVIPDAVFTPSENTEASKEAEAVEKVEKQVKAPVKPKRGRKKKNS